MRFDSQFWRMNCQINELSNFSTASLQVNGFDGIGVGARLPLTGLPDLLPIIVILAPKRLWTIPISGLVISVPNADRCPHLRPNSTARLNSLGPRKPRSICADTAGATLIARRCRFYPTPRAVKMYLSSRDAAGSPRLIRGETQRPKKEHGTGPKGPGLRPKGCH